MHEVEQFRQASDFLLVDEAYAGLGYFPFKDAFVAGVTEQAHIHCSRFVEHVFERDVGYQVLREVLIGFGIGGVVAADHYLEAVVEQRFAHTVAIIHRCCVGSVDSFVVLVDAERYVNTFYG